MKKFAVAVGAIIFSTSAYAADLAPVRAVPFSWTGFYIGANVGAGWNSGKQISDTTYHYPGGDVGTYDNGWFNAESSSDNTSFTGGGQLGYNRQLGNFVVGIEADLNYINIKSDYSTTYNYTLPWPPNYVYNLTEDMESRVKVEWFGTIRPRLGVTVWERLLVYGTGGVAYGQVKSSAGYQWHEFGYWWGGPGDHEFNRIGGFRGSPSGIRWGWTVGGGAEYALTNQISVKGEYLYVDLGDKDHTVVSPDDAAELVTWRDSASFHTVRAGLNYRF